MDMKYFQCTDIVINRFSYIDFGYEVLKYKEHQSVRGLK